MIRSSNPALSEKVFAKHRAETQSDVMTFAGTKYKTLIMLALVVLGASYTWRLASIGAPSTNVWMIAGGIGGFITAIITAFSPRSAHITAPIYSVLQGLLLGGLSAFMAAQFEMAIIMQAVGLTFATFFLMLLLYQSGTIKVTAKFRMGVFAATGAIALMYFISFIMSFFNVSIPFIHQGGAIGIIISLVVITVAALNLALDFDMIERGVRQGAPKYMEWYGAFALMVTLIWLYIEFLRLLAKVSSRR
ncbi:MAG: Bax inhibitor-1/YccA family protein [Bacteroidales bacterium]